MNKLNFDNMSRDELAYFIVAHRNTSDAVEARRVYIRRMAEKAKASGIEFYRANIEPKPVDNNIDR